MSIKRIEIPEPPRPPPPPLFFERLVCDGCGWQVDGAMNGAVWTLPNDWLRVYITGRGGDGWTHDLCPKCRGGAVLALPGGNIIRLEAK